MKTTHILFIFFLFSLSVEAQSYKSNLIQTIDAINAILHENKNVQFTNQDYNLFYPTKINANILNYLTYKSQSFK
jgi:hypothetical protein